MKIKKNIERLILSAFIISCLLSAAGCRTIVKEPSVTPKPADSPDGESAPNAGELEPLTVTVLKIGKADAIILQTGDKTMLIDAGETDDGAEIVNFLKTRGVTSLECMIITHYDKDHVGGACAVLGAFNVERILLPDYEGTNREYYAFKNVLKTYPTKAERLISEVRFSFGSVNITVQPPFSYEIKNPNKENDNNFSLLTWAEHGKNRLFFTGDIEKARIKEWLASEKNPKCDFLKFPHHGVYNKALNDFLDAVRPEYTVICSSNKNPADEKTLRLLESKGIKTFETRNGNVTVISDGANITVTQ